MLCEFLLLLASWKCCEHGIQAGHPFKHVEMLQEQAQQILGIEKDAGGTYNMTEEIAANIDSLWQHPLVKEAYDNRAEYQLYDSAL